MIWFDSHFDMMVWIRRSLETNWRAEGMAFSFLSSLVALLKELLRRFPLYLVAEWRTVELKQRRKNKSPKRTKMPSGSNKTFEIFFISTVVCCWRECKNKDSINYFKQNWIYVSRFRTVDYEKRKVSNKMKRIGKNSKGERMSSKKRSSWKLCISNYAFLMTFRNLNFAAFPRPKNVWPRFPFLQLLNFGNGL